MIAWRTRLACSALALLVALSTGGAAQAGGEDPRPTASATSAAAGPAPAPTPQDKALAEGLFQDGRKLMDAGQLPEACAKLAESQRLDPSAGTLLNLALCHEKQGKVASAWAELKEAASMSAAAGKQDRADYASKRSADLEARLSRLVLEIPTATPGLVLELNDKELNAAAAAGSGMPLDPGEYTIDATAPGKKPWSERVTIEAAPGAKRVTIPALQDAPKAPPPPPPKTTPKAAPAPVDEGGGIPRRTLGFVAGGLGIVGLGVGSVFGILTFSSAGDADKACDPGDVQCGQDRQDAYDAGQTSGLISTLAFGAGAALLGAGAFLVLMPDSEERPDAKQGVWLSPRVGAEGAQMTLGGSF